MIDGEAAGPGSTGEASRSPSGVRPAQPEPFVRGCAWRGAAGVPYPRAAPEDRSRLPIDTWTTATLPVGVRLEFVGDATEVEISYTTASQDLGYRGDGAGRSFELWRGDRLVDQRQAVLGAGRVVLSAGSGPEPAIVYLPEGMRPTVTSLAAVGGSVAPAPRQPRWLAYGDSVAEGWIASGPAGAWPAIVGRRCGLDVHNLGYAGAARGEIVSAEQLAAIDAHVISISHGTNCWTRVPFSVSMMYENTRAFLEVVRQGHPQTPVVVVSPILRPDAESTANRLGATLEDLRFAMERAVTERQSAGDVALWLIPGRDLLPPGQLGDGIHPNDEGHQTLAAVVGAKLKEVAWSS